MDRTCRVVRNEAASAEEVRLLTHMHRFAKLKEKRDMAISTAESETCQELETGLRQQIFSLSFKLKSATYEN
jgi:hypothetical protein